MRVLISGATGLIGTALGKSLTEDGHTVVRLTRSPRSPDDRGWDPVGGEMDRTALDRVDAVIHLAGESIGSHRWSEKQRRRIMDSRVLSTRLLRTAIEERSDRPKSFVSASAMGYYGDRGDEELTESSPPGRGFLSEVCIAWETEARTDATRCAMVRTGLVVTPKGGALQRMLLPARLGLAGPIGNGRQWWSWITLDDVVGIYRHLALDSALEGPVNAAAPKPVRQKEFARELGRVLHRPAFIPLPRLAIKAVLGEMGENLLFDSDRLRSERIAGDGYAFRHAQLSTALDHLLG